MELLPPAPVGFWSDGFDLDLLTLIPDLRERLGPIADLTLVTHGHITDGRLNHPAVWNSGRGLLAFFGFVGPDKPEAYVTDRPVVACTFLEALRDAWLHDYAIIVNGFPVLNADLRPLLNRIMFLVRGGRDPDGGNGDAMRRKRETERAIADVCTRIARARFWLEIVHEAWVERQARCVERAVEAAARP